MRLPGNKRGARLTVSIVLVLLCLCIVVAIWYVIRYQIKLNTDAQDMRNIINRNLRLGSSHSMVETFIHSQAMKIYIETHGYIETTEDSLQVQKVSRYIVNLPGWQSYPNGSALQVSMNSNPYGTIMSLQFFFSARNGLTHYKISTSWAGI